MLGLRLCLHQGVVGRQCRYEATTGGVVIHRLWKTDLLKRQVTRGTVRVAVHLICHAIFQAVERVQGVGNNLISSILRAATTSTRILAIVLGLIASLVVMVWAQLSTR